MLHTTDIGNHYGWLAGAVAVGGFKRGALLDQNDDIHGCKAYGYWRLLIPAVQASRAPCKACVRFL